ncbi:hypothetical protein BDF14DRAFT_1845017 [Spinellus fusiger]|nr:hypothetical protein BDF14DRAFT_1845017 [Spinellus fusiger]
MAERDIELANYMLSSIHKDLSFLKDHKFVSLQTYEAVIAQLPLKVEGAKSVSSRPPLPIRKSTTPTPSPTPAPRELSATLSNPKLPFRRSLVPPEEKLVPAQVQPQPQVQTQAQSQVQPHQTLARAIQSYVATPTSDAPPAYSDASNSSIATAEALYDYSGDDPSTDLSFRQGQIIQVTEYVNNDWWKGNLEGKSGIFPQNHVKKIATPTPPKAKRPTIPSPQPSNSAKTSMAAPTSLPYSYPPPPTAIYHAPPPITSATQATAAYYSTPPVTSVYATPPNHVYQSPSAAPAAPPAPEEDGQNKVANMAKKFGGNVATAATWGFGATLGAEAAHAIF